MTTPNDPDLPPPGKDASVEEIEADIARTRENLGNTVDELTQKFDVKAQAQNKVQDIKERAEEQVHTAQVRGGEALSHAKATATDEQGKVKPAIPAVGAVVLVATVLALVIWRRRQ
ncbi:MAG: DUF3618 domain-containing protein [Mycobacteriaceae bacterium]